MLVHINTIQNEWLHSLADLTGIDKKKLVEEALALFLERWEYVLNQDPYYPILETEHYESLVLQECTLEIDLEHIPGKTIATFLKEHYSLNTVSLSYVLRKALALLFEGKPVQ